MTSTNFDLEIRKITLGDIRVSKRLRPIDSAQVDLLADSMAAKGLLEPIIVMVDGDKIDLVAGAHRVAAAKQLGWPDIAAIPKSRMTVNERRLIEIDENLARHELNPLDRAIFIAQRKHIFELENPDIGHGGDRRSDQAANFATWSSFAEETAEQVGLSERSIRRAAAIAQGLTPATRKALAGTPLVRKEGELFKLSKIARDEQVAVLELALSGDGLSIDAADRMHTGKPDKPKDKAADQAAKLAALWDKLPDKARVDFVRTRWDELVMLKGDA
ncbi:MAG: ParB N-terminal domain-containing protein [Alphaproteobacteria bacterium]